MSVNSKMTAIADEVRTLAGVENKLNLDTMASHTKEANTEVGTQEEIIQQIRTALQGKTASGGSADPVIEPLEVTENGTYTAPDGVDGYSPVTVNVAESGSDDALLIAVIEGDGANITELPDGVKKIHAYCFYSDHALTSMKLPESIGTIEDYAFTYCSKLSLSKLPDSLTSIGSYAFRGCSVLALTELPDSLTSIGSNAFYMCKQLAIVEIPAGITTLSAYVFADTQCHISTLPEGLKRIENFSFSGCKNLAITEMPAGVISIGQRAFGSCTGLTEITFKGQPTSIYNNAFYQCTNITTINVPWAEGAVSSAPWGATNAIINYNYTGG